MHEMQTRSPQRLHAGVAGGADICAEAVPWQRRDGQAWAGKQLHPCTQTTAAHGNHTQDEPGPMPELHCGPESLWCGPGIGPSKNSQ